MSWPIPLPTAIADKASSVYEGRIEGIDARSPNSVAAANARVTSMAAFDLYLHQLDIADEVMVDTAIDNLPRHGAIWGVPQLQPAAAIGNATSNAPAGFVIPAQALLTAPSGQTYVTTAASEAPAPVSVSASLTGVAGNAPAGTVLTFATPLLGFSPSQITVDVNGLSGGAAIESPDAWRARILARIRRPPNGGSLGDYATWAVQAGAGYVGVVKDWIGGGSVGVIVAVSDAGAPAVPTPVQLAVIDAYLQSVAPVTAQVVTVAGSLLPIAFTLHLNPDTVAIRLAAQAALALAIAQDATVGGTITMSRMDAALEASDGEFSHERTAPAADVVCGQTQLPVLGPVTFV